MNIREKVVQVLDSKAFDHFDTSALVTLIVTAFLEAATERGWHMQPDETDPDMYDAGEAVLDTENGNLFTAYRAMLAAAPKFEWDK